MASSSSGRTIRTGSASIARPSTSLRSSRTSGYSRKRSVSQRASSLLASIRSARSNTTSLRSISHPAHSRSGASSWQDSIDVGTMVIVLPWHDPLRVAEEISMLDNMRRDRRVNVGFGRRLARRDFEPFNSRSAKRAAASGKALKSSEVPSRRSASRFRGESYRVAETALRPRPRSAKRCPKV